MFQLKNDQKIEIRSDVRGGKGELPFCHLFSADQLGGRADMMARITLQPGQSIGVHPHIKNAEAYYVLKGTVTVTEDGEERTLTVGDAEFCADGHTHAIENRSQETVEFLALILKNL